VSKQSCREIVLVVDDDPDLRSLISTIGEMCGVPIIEAPDCSTALNVLEREGLNLKLILLDYFMPGMPPAQCASAIIARAGSAIPVVLITAAFDPAALAAELKLARWISKPFEISELTDLLTQSPVSNVRSQTRRDPWAM
jgi:CheY-like chemotaxis protein